MESPSEASTKENINTPEHKARIYNLSYHKKNIRIIELDHQSSRLDKVELKFPLDWRDQIRRNMDQNNCPIAPEYCIPDLYRHAYKELLSGPFINTGSLNAEGSIHGFFSFLSRLAGSEGRKQIAVDPANTNVYLILEVIGSAKFLMQEEFYQTFKNKEKDGRIDPSGNYNNIKEREIRRNNSNDARHLITARGLMEEVIRGNFEGDPTIIHINTPFHSERIANYIKRQSEWENNSSIKVEEPQDIKYVSPPHESKKMNFWYKGPLQRNLREYSPLLPPEAFKIDLFFHDDEGRIVKTDTRRQIIEKLKLLEGKIDRYLAIQPKDKTEQKYQKRLGLAKHLIKICNTRNWLAPIIYSKLSPLIDTNKIGWRLTRKSYIY